MTAIQLLVQAAEILQAIAEMNKAAETYRDAVDACKSAAEDLASKWEGAAKDAFVAHQQTAYNWHLQILEVIRKLIEAAQKAIELYEEMEDAVKSIVK